jgi:hypothetical protein
MAALVVTSPWDASRGGSTTSLDRSSPWKLAGLSHIGQYGPHDAVEMAKKVHRLGSV